jgi:nickel/cobalt exporter
MPDIVSLIQQGSSNLFIFIPIAILLGGLHGLEPGHSKTMMAAFLEFTEHHHRHSIPQMSGLDLVAPDQYQDPHELAHANDIRHRFAADQNVTIDQIIMFGLTDGLIPCPASITVLLLCLQLKKIALGALLVLRFSIGLALTMVASGVFVALGAKHLSKRWSGFSKLIQKVPYFSSALIILIGIYFGYNDLMAIL